MKISQTFETNLVFVSCAHFKETKCRIHLIFVDCNFDHPQSLKRCHLCPQKTLQKAAFFTQNTVFGQKSE